MESGSVLGELLRILRSLSNWAEVHCLESEFRIVSDLESFLYQSNCSKRYNGDIMIYPLDEEFNPAAEKYQYDLFGYTVPPGYSNICTFLQSELSDKSSKLHVCLTRLRSERHLDTQQLFAALTKHLSDGTSSLPDCARLMIGLTGLTSGASFEEILAALLGSSVLGEQRISCSGFLSSLNHNEVAGGIAGMYILASGLEGTDDETALRFYANVLEICPLFFAAFEGVIRLTFKSGPPWKHLPYATVEEYCNYICSQDNLSRKLFQNSSSPTICLVSNFLSHYVKCYLALAQGKVIVALNQLLGIPSHFRATGIHHWLAGQCYLNRSMYDVAYQHFRQGIRFIHHRKTTLPLLSLCLWHVKDAFGILAFKAFASPTSPEYLCLASNEASVRGNHLIALKFLNDIPGRMLTIAKYFKAHELISLHRWKEAEELLTDLLATPHLALNIPSSFARMYLRQNNIPTAEAHYLTALVPNGENEELLINLLSCCLKNQHPSKFALNIASQAIPVDSRNPKLSFLCASVLLRNGRYEEAERALEKARRISPLDSSVSAAVARCLSGRRNLIGAWLEANVAYCLATDLKTQRSLMVYMGGLWLGKSEVRKSAEEEEEFTLYADNGRDEVTVYEEKAQRSSKKGFLMDLSMILPLCINAGNIEHLYPITAKLMGCSRVNGYYYIYLGDSTFLKTSIQPNFLKSFLPINEGCYYLDIYTNGTIYDFDIYRKALKNSKETNPNSLIYLSSSNTVNFVYHEKLNKENVENKTDFKFCLDCDPLQPFLPMADASLLPINKGTILNKYEKKITSKNTQKKDNKYYNQPKKKTIIDIKTDPRTSEFLNKFAKKRKQNHRQSTEYPFYIELAAENRIQTKASSLIVFSVAALKPVFCRSNLLPDSSTLQ